MSHSPNSQDSGGSDLDLDPVEAKLFPDGELFAPASSRERRACSQALPAAAEHIPPGNDLGTSPEHPSSHWEGGGLVSARPGSVSLHGAR